MMWCLAVLRGTGIQRDDARTFMQVPKEDDSGISMDNPAMRGQ